MIKHHLWKKNYSPVARNFQCIIFNAKFSVFSFARAKNAEVTGECVSVFQRAFQLQLRRTSELLSGDFFSKREFFYKYLFIITARVQVGHL